MKLYKGQYAYKISLNRKIKWQGIKTKEILVWVYNKAEPGFIEFWLDRDSTRFLIPIRIIDFITDIRIKE